MKTTITLMLLAITASSCYTAGKARRQMVHAQAAHPDVVAGICEQVYPPTDSIHTELQYLQGEIRYLPGGTRYVNCDSGHNKGNSRVAVPCPPAIYRVDTIRNRRTVYLVNRAKDQAQERKIAVLTESNSRLYAEKKLLIYWALAATLAALLFLTLLMKNK